MSATIKVFQVGAKCFKHVMNTDHDRVELRDENDKTLLTYSEDTKVFDLNGPLGNFNIDYIDGKPRWIFYAMADKSCIELGPDLHTAKVEVSKHYIRQLAIGNGLTHAVRS